MKQRNSVQNNVQTKTFKLPTIFGKKLNDAQNSMRPMKFNNLSELANAHLSTTKLSNEPSKTLSQNINIPQQMNQSKFVLPKLNGGHSSVSPNSADDSLTPHEMSLKKIMDLKRLNISSGHSRNDTENTPPVNIQTVTSIDASIECKTFSIDLASALNDPKLSKTAIIAPTKPIVEEIDFKFIDCDIAEQPERQPQIKQDCCLDLSNILDKHFEHRTKCTTELGRILCSKYKRKQLPSIKHGFVSKHKIKPFNFDIKVKPVK